MISYNNEIEARARMEQIDRVGGRLAVRDWVDHVYMHSDQLNEIIDGGQLCNHSENPTSAVGNNEEGHCYESSYSIKDLKAGEQYTENYGTYDYPEWYLQLLIEFDVSRAFVADIQNK